MLTACHNIENIFNTEVDLFSFYVNTVDQANELILFS